MKVVFGCVEWPHAHIMTQTGCGRTCIVFSFLRTACIRSLHAEDEGGCSILTFFAGSLLKSGCRCCWCYRVRKLSEPFMLSVDPSALNPRELINHFRVIGPRVLVFKESQ